MNSSPDIRYYGMTTEFDASDGRLSPALFVAVTVKVSVEPDVRPGTTIDVAVPG